MRSRCQNKLDQKLHSKLESMNRGETIKTSSKPLNMILQMPKILPSAEQDGVEIEAEIVCAANTPPMTLVGKRKIKDSQLLRQKATSTESEST